MFQVKLTDFRCFANPPPVDLCPITLLVGENSSGKTSFMAAVWFLLGAFLSVEFNPFNEEPFRLGGFDEIVNYSRERNKPRRAARFMLEIQDRDVRHIFAFTRGIPQPELAEYKFEGSELAASYNTGNGKLTINGSDGLMVEYEPKGIPPAPMFRREFHYIRYIFQAMPARLSDEVKAKAIPDLESRLTALEQAYWNSLQRVTRELDATAPVRSKPARVYVPSDIVASAEGQGVPLELARLRMTNRRGWAAMHSGLAKFGTKSGLFDDIEIKSFGIRRPNDPFQILVKTGGPFMNIMDVGYGVSQALPIIYDLEQARQRETFFLQQPEVHLHPRAQAELGSLLVSAFKQQPSTMYLVETHSDYIIDRIRMEVRGKRLSHDNVTIVFFDKTDSGVQPTNIYLSEDGDVITPPDNYRAFFLEEQQRLLGF